MNFKILKLQVLSEINYFIFNLYATAEYDPTLPFTKTKIIITNNEQPINIQFSLRKDTKTNSWQIVGVNIDDLPVENTKSIEWIDYFKDNASFKKLIRKLEEIAKNSIIVK